MISSEETKTPLFLGIECGGTRSVAILAQQDGTQLLQSETGPANLRLLKDHELLSHFQKISDLQKGPPTLSGLAIGMAGARTEMDRERIRAAAAKVWPEIPCYATSDLETALIAADGHGEAHPRVLILSGTGSCCFGQTLQGKTAKVGGWGHFLGDKGSGYEIGLRALKAVVFYYDRDGSWPLLGQKILRTLQLNEPNDLIGWVQTATKAEIAALALQVFEAWHRKDKIAADIIASAASSLAHDAVHCAHRLVKLNATVHFILSGSILLKQPDFANEVRKQLNHLWKHAIVTSLNRDSAWGAVLLAKKHFGGNGSDPVVARNFGSRKKRLKPPVLTSHNFSPTEQRNPLSVNLDQLPVQKMIALMMSEEGKIPAAILAESHKIEHAVQLISTAFKCGGRLFYVGAGTSGRLGVLDASECPPTFRTSPEMVQGIIAGGQTALWKAVEGAEDDLFAGAEAINYNGITPKDVVVGIAASGRTPFVWGALQEAKTRHASTILICFDPELKIAAEDRPKIVIAPKVGPEVLTGSTRLKAGTATKLILNMLTTLSMVRLGKVVSNLMVDLNPSNVKLRDRAVRIVREIMGVEPSAAFEALEHSKWVVKAACERLRTNKSKKTSSRKKAGSKKVKK